MRSIDPTDLRFDLFGGFNGPCVIPKRPFSLAHVPAGFQHDSYSAAIRLGGKQYV